MFRDFLVGYTGFVGSNLVEEHQFSGLFNSKNIAEAYGQRPDLLVYAGVSAEMFLANRNPAEDLGIIDVAKENMRRIAPNSVVLISTVAVYPDTRGANEDTEIDDTRLPPYGAHRHALETWVEENIKSHLIIRLPAIFGRNLKKNFLYDFIHEIPSLLTKTKMAELLVRAPELTEYYFPRGDGFFKCRNLSVAEEASVKGIFHRLNFTALNFTDSRSVYQFYPLKNLWHDIEVALANNLRRVNLVTPPISAAKVYHFLTGKSFGNELDRPVFNYDLRTKYEALFGGHGGYIMELDQELSDIKEFVRQNGERA